jgi:hypothetical protein
MTSPCEHLVLPELRDKPVGYAQRVATGVLASVAETSTTVWTAARIWSRRCSSKRRSIQVNLAEVYLLIELARPPCVPPRDATLKDFEQFLIRHRLRPAPEAQRVVPEFSSGRSQLPPQHVVFRARASEYSGRTEERSLSMSGPRPLVWRAGVCWLTLARTVSRPGVSGVSAGG